MPGRAAGIVLVVFLSPTPVVAQDAVFTVSAASADVYKSPSTGSPVIGRATRGSDLRVTRELGSWVRVDWPDAPDGVGFVHVSMGTLANGSSPESIRAAAGAAVRSLPEEPAAGDERAAASLTAGVRSGYVMPSHRLGVGAAMVSGSPRGFAATTRFWHKERVGLRVDVARYAVPTLPAGHFTSVHVEPSVLVSVTDRLTNYFWFRPYVGGGVSLRRNAPDQSVGMQAFGGSEVTFAGAPQLAVSADFGYRSRQSTLELLRLGGFGLSVSAHWYLK